jgi:fibronectin-binding autotransporter adhesin
MITKIQKFRRTAAVSVFALAVVVSQFSGVQFAHATGGTDTWVGGSGNNFSTAANWSADAVPNNGDSLVFNGASLTSDATPNNDMSGLSVAGITFSGTNSGTHSFTAITGNAITLTGNLANTEQDSFGAVPANLDMSITLGTDVTVTGPFSFGFIDNVATTITTQGHNLIIGNENSYSCSGLQQISGSGALTINPGTSGGFSLGTNSPNYTGAISQSSGTLYAVGPGSLGSSTGLTVSGAGNFDLFDNGSTSTWAVPVTLGGSGVINAEHSGVGCSGSSDSSVNTATLTGAVTLTSDFIFQSQDNITVSGTYTDNGHSFTAANGISGTLTLPSGTITAPVVTNTYSDSQPNAYLDVGNNETAILDGSRGNVQVDAGGTLEGNGTANTIDVDGTLAPGHSPGKLTVVTTLTLESDSTYQAQLKDATAGDYDQMVVGTSADTTGNDVTINAGAKLDTELYTGYNIKKGDSFEIINNQSTTPVSGTFDDASGNPLAEGSQFTVGNLTFSITYVGGDGNDVVLTALDTGSDPSAPNTAFAHLMMANPAIIAGLGIVTAGFFTVLAARRRANR